MRALRGFAVSRSIGQISTLAAGQATEGFSTAVTDIIELFGLETKPNCDFSIWKNARFSGGPRISSTGKSMQRPDARVFSERTNSSWTDGFAEGSVGPRPVRELDYLFGGVGPVGSDRHSAERRFQMSPLRMRMIEDMKLAGLSPGTQATYIDAVRKLAAYYRRSPDQLSEEEVRALYPPPA